MLQVLLGKRDPAIDLPLGPVQTWPALGAQHEEVRQRAELIWDSTVLDLAGSQRAQAARSPMSAAILVLLDVGWQPLSPWKWQAVDRSLYDAPPGELDAEAIVDHLIRDMANQLWASAQGGGFIWAWNEAWTSPR